MARIDNSGDVTKCWLAPDELEELERAASAVDREHEITMQLMGRCNFRADEVSYPGDRHLAYSEDGAVWPFVVREKNTEGGAKAPCDAWMPDDVHKYSRERGLAAADPRPGCRCRPRTSVGGSEKRARSSSTRPTTGSNNALRVTTSSGRWRPTGSSSATPVSGRRQTSFNSSATSRMLSTPSPLKSKHG